MTGEGASGLVVGSGDFLYDVVRPWGRLPAGWRLGLVSHVAVDAADRVYFYQRQDPPVLVFDRDGGFLTAWGSRRLGDAHGIFAGPDGHLYVCDRDAHEVLKLTPEGRVVLTLGQRGRPALQAPFNHPADVAVAPSGNIYVADGYGNSAVHRFSPDGRHRGSWGRPGAGPGEFTTPHGIWVDAAERVLVADRENNRVQLFSPEGDYYGEWRDLYHPMDIYVDGTGAVYVTDQIPRLSVYAADGRLLARGKPVAIGAHGLWGDSRGDLYLAEVGMHQVTKLVRRPRAGALAERGASRAGAGGRKGPARHARPGGER
ncbi:MAG TPA: peptidyl-alpha-hydroxyglycine alpha-amidating lyase family protein [Methylomirabilota bacterium]|nr:peptidyl-alpha-hydroxyglycine alpha-amidating lyase family protein [Methylomirabilota bacterium]